MNPVRFIDKEHENFYMSMLSRGGSKDAYHRAFFYTAGIADETRRYIHHLFDFANHCIKPEGLAQSWQTGSTSRLCRLAFNLWNGWTEDEKERLSSPYELFDCTYAPYFFEAIRLRYPEYCRSQQRISQRLAGPYR